MRRVPTTGLPLFWSPALFSVLTLYSAGPGAAQTEGSPARIHVYDQQIEVRADGTATDLIHLELQVPTARDINQLGQLPIAYRASMQDVDVLEAYTRKPDGEKFDVDPGAIITREDPGASSVPSYSDEKEKLIVFPQAEPGDTLVYTARRRDKVPDFPGHFEIVRSFSPIVPIDAATVTISAPRSLGISVEAHGVEVHEDKSIPDKDLYTLRYANRTPAAEDNAAISALDRVPRYFASNFKSYDDLAQTYAAMIQSRAAATTKIKAKAESITSGITDRREQARAIYEWVSQHIRYVAITFGQGGYVPHEAETVLNNGFGDCKDHTTLFMALLKAKGIDSEPVLINAENGYSLSSVPTTAQLDHMIAWLPEFKLYADTTARIVPFGYLVPSEYGKPVVVIAKDQPALHQTPVLPPDAGTITYHNVARLDDGMRLTSEGTTIATGAFVAELRFIGESILARGPHDSAATLLEKHGYPNATGTLIASDSGGIVAAYSISSKFSVPASVNMQILEPGLRLMPATGDFLMGPLLNAKIKDTDPTPCYSGHTTEDLALDFPATRRLVRLPQDADVKTANLHYSSHWSVKGHTVSVHREFISNIDDALCSGEVRKDTAGALAGILKDQAASISFAELTGPTPVTVNFAPGDKTVDPERATSAGDAAISQSGLPTSKNAPHIDSLNLSYERSGNGTVFAREEFVFHSVKGNATASHVEVVNTSGPAPDIHAKDGTIESAPDQQQRGAIHTRWFNCGRFRTPFSLVERATIVDADGEKSNSVDFAIRCPGAIQ